MPAAHINILKGHERSQLRRLIVEVSDTLARILGAPRDRLEVWITEIDPELWGVSGVPAAEVLSHTPLPEAEMPFIQMVLLEGRPREQHHALIAEITEVVARVLGTRRERIRMHIAESRTDCWGIGGVPASVARAEEIRARAAQGGG